MDAEAVATIRDPAQAVFFSAASVWELELKSASGKLELPDDWIEVARQSGFIELPVLAVHARASARLPWHHRDPFDRMLVAQAQEQSLRVATRDDIMGRYGVPLLLV
jgi:PIN domain nuclease of toxin-antitoxin system